MASNDVHGLPRTNRRRAIHEKDVEFARLNNQFFLQGASPQFPDDFSNENIIVFLEYVQSSGTFTIEGANGVVSGALTSPFGDAHGAIRLDGGVKLNGTILGAKGYFIQTN